jgi:signal transduction histidine kinase
MIVERHGGKLSAASKEKGTGALFQFTLPIKPGLPEPDGASQLEQS